jgi:hypothetical protein
MKTNELKKGDRIELANGWQAEIADNLKGNRRLAKVFGLCTETGSVYAHDIYYHLPESGERILIEHTSAQRKLRDQLLSFNNMTRRY